MDGTEIPRAATQTQKPGAEGAQMPETGARRQPRIGPLSSMAECPLHAAMRQLAQAAVLQHVLHLEGEWLPRPELLRAVEGWATLLALVRVHVCPATREAPLEPSELASSVEGAIAPLFTPQETPLRAQLLRTIARCAACSPAMGCPLEDPLTEQSDGYQGIC